MKKQSERGLKNKGQVNNSSGLGYAQKVKIWIFKAVNLYK